MKESANAIVEAPQSSLAAQNAGVGIGGLEGIDPSTMPIPFVRLVQPTSKKIATAEGEDAANATYYFGDTKESIKELTCVILKGKHGPKTFPDPKTGEKKTKTVLALLCVLPDEDNKLFILSLSATSFGAFGSLVAMLKKQKVMNVWEVKVKMTAHMTENELGKYAVADFAIAGPLDGEQVAKMSELYDKYEKAVEKNAFDREDSEPVVPVDADPSEDQTPF